MTNAEELRALEILYTSDQVCDRTGKPHESWEPIVQDGLVTAFRSKEEAEYPSGLCEAFAEAAVRRFEKRGMDAKDEAKAESHFIEIFSGPNAPLSKAMASKEVMLAAQEESEDEAEQADLVGKGSGHGACRWSSPPWPENQCP